MVLIGDEKIKIHVSNNMTHLFLTYYKIASFLKALFRKSYFATIHYSDTVLKIGVSTHLYRRKAVKTFKKVVVNLLACRVIF